LSRPRTTRTLTRTTKKHKKPRTTKTNKISKKKTATKTTKKSTTATTATTTTLRTTRTFLKRNSSSTSPTSSLSLRMPFVEGDRIKIEELIEAALKTAQKHPDAKPDLDGWTKIFAGACNIRCRSKKKTVKHLGVMLASSDPNEIFSILEFDGKQLVQGTSIIAHAWAGACTFYGPGWIPEITVSLDVSAGIAPPTAWSANRRDLRCHPISHQRCLCR
jgi:hypothetical protein